MRIPLISASLMCIVLSCAAQAAAPGDQWRCEPQDFPGMKLRVSLYEPAVVTEAGGRDSQILTRNRIWGFKIDQNRCNLSMRRDDSRYHFETDCLATDSRLPDSSRIRAVFELEFASGDASLHISGSESLRMDYRLGCRSGAIPN
jgi:hypothetical protein